MAAQISQFFRRSLPLPQRNRSTLIKSLLILQVVLSMDAFCSY